MADEEKDCVFCKIVKGEISAEKIYEDDYVLAFLDINPVNHGHLLEIPKEHYQWMYDVPDDLLSKIFIESKKLMKAIKDVFNADYIAESVIGIDVPHFHVHLIPRYFDDGMQNFWPTKKYAKGKDKEIAEKIKNALKND